MTKKLKSSSLYKQCLSTSYSTSEQIEEYVEAMVNNSVEIINTNIQNGISSKTLIIGNNNSIIRDETIENAFNGIAVIGENNIAIGKHSVAEGNNNIVGCKVCQIISGDVQAKTITLSIDLKEYKDILDTYISGNNKTNATIAYKLESNYYDSKIVDINYETNTLSLDLLVTPTNNNTKLPGGIIGIGYDGYDPKSDTFIVNNYGYTDLSGNYIPKKTDTCYKLWFTNANLSGYLVGDIIGDSLGKNSHVEGGYNSVYGDYAHAEGYGNNAIGRFSHVEGLYTKAGYAAHAEGRSTNATGEHSHAEGFMTNAYAHQSHAAGCKCTVLSNDIGAFVWNGNSTPSNGAHYYSHGTGTFNIYPKDGIKGFYIGNNNFINCVLSAINQMDVNQKKILKDILNSL